MLIWTFRCDTYLLIIRVGYCLIDSFMRSSLRMRLKRSILIEAIKTSPQENAKVPVLLVSPEISKNMIPNPPGLLLLLRGGGLSLDQFFCIRKNTVNCLDFF